jgi:site-specific DNA-methyltransferase (adenine-specific)
MREAGCERLDRMPFETNHPYGAGAEARAESNQQGSRNNHPTVKPTALMRYLIRLVTPPGGIVLDPFVGSGSTGKACRLEGFDFVGIELDPHYAEIARLRIG